MPSKAQQVVATRKPRRGAKVKPATYAAVTTILGSPSRHSTPPKLPQSVLASTERLSPYQRLLQLNESRPPSAGTDRRIVSSVEEVQELLKNKLSPPPNVVLEMKLLWVSGHAYQRWNLTRLHFVDATTAGSLDELLEVFQAHYDENMDKFNSVLLTVTLWGVDSKSSELPPPGAIVRINKYSALKLFKEEQCQVTVTLRDLSWAQ